MRYKMSEKSLLAQAETCAMGADVRQVLKSCRHNFSQRDAVRV